MNERLTEEFRGLFARLDDLSERADGGQCVHTPFLSPKERMAAEGYLRTKGKTFCSFGGYEEAERRMLYLLPDYMEGGEEDGVEALLAAYGQSTDLAVLLLQGSGYRVLGHRDFLGALLHLGIERSVLGDIAVFSEGSGALLFCEQRMAEFIASELSKAGSDRLTVHNVTDDPPPVPPRLFESVRDTVASPRLDAVVAALCRTSREKGATLVRSGSVELNYEQEDRPDRTVTAGAIISVRGFGKFRIRSVQEQTKKGRIRLEAEKYV